MKNARALKFSLPIICLVVSAFSFRVSAEDWSQFRGPNGTGISASKGLPVEFGAQKNVIWKTALPAGHSSPVLGRDRIFLTGFEGNKLFTICLDRKSGKLLWQREAPHNHAHRLVKPNNPASPSPVTDGENVYAFFQDFGLIAYKPDGTEAWRLPLGPFNSQWGMAASPILSGSRVILACDQDTNSFLIAVDKNNGRIKWKTDRPEVVSGYSTPILYRPKSGPEQIVIAESFQLSAYSVETGEKLWWVRGLACEMKSIPAMDGDVIYINGWGFPENQPGKQVPVRAFAEVLPTYDTNKDGKISKAEAVEAQDQKLKSEGYFNVFDLNHDGLLDEKDWGVFRAMMASENGLLSIKLGGRGDMTDNSVRWRYQRPVPQVPSTLVYKNVLYMVNDGGVLISFDPATGAVIKQGRLEGAIDKYFASPVAADDKVYMVSEAGAVSVLKAGGEWQILAVNHLDDECYATPAIADGRIYIRTRSALYCFAQRD